ncbi:MAG: tRNA dihydrouridine synthase DusB [Candidatus Omnitrophica bacterium]|nr:tRNA dihydrouridine synthase DusB [Candidatus Omnitrophota bacterium]
MAGITDLPFRMLNRKFGCELAFIEMINVRSLGYNSKNTKKMFATNAKDKPLGVQLVASEPKYMARGLDIAKQFKFDLMDFNAACPVRKVVNRGEGAALLKDPKKLQVLLKLVRKEFTVPVTVKIRIGWDEHSINACEVAKHVVDAGVDAIFIHGRTRQQFYSGGVDYKEIAKVKKNVSIPVIASGDNFSGPLIKKMFDETGCDACVIARGSFGNPWIFKEAKEFLKSGKMIPRPSIKDIIKVMKEHLEANMDFHGATSGLVQFRKFFAWYTKFMPHVRPLREQATRIKTKQEMFVLIEKLGE